MWTARRSAPASSGAANRQVKPDYLSRAIATAIEAAERSAALPQVKARPKQRADVTIAYGPSTAFHISSR